MTSHLVITRYFLEIMRNFLEIITSHLVITRYLLEIMKLSQNNDFTSRNNKILSRNNEKLSRNNDLLHACAIHK